MTRHFIKLLRSNQLYKKRSLLTSCSISGYHQQIILRQQVANYSFYLHTRHIPIMGTKSKQIN